MNIVDKETTKKIDKFKIAALRELQKENIFVEIDGYDGLYSVEVTDTQIVFWSQTYSNINVVIRVEKWVPLTITIQRQKVSVGMWRLHGRENKARDQDGGHATP